MKPRIARDRAYPAPTSGWIRNENLASPNARRPDGSKILGADTLENFFPTATGVQMRGGASVHTTTGEDGDIVSMFTYVNGNNRSLFIADGVAIYDASTAAEIGALVDEDGNELVDENGDTLVFVESPAAPVLEDQTGGEWSVVQFATAGGVFLRGVNGLDTPFVYDGTDFDVTPAITGSGLDPEDLSFVWAYKNRLFFVEKDSLNAWYLDVDEIGGTATKFPLGGVFNLGGSLLFGASWSLDSGDSGGLSEQCVFFSTEGEVAVYRGADPSDANDWGKVGVYRIGKPRGPNAIIRAGGDLVIATDIGFVPLSQAIQRDYAAISPVAVSYPIEVAWNEAVTARAGENWHCEVWPAKQMVMVALPTEDGQQPQIFVANARTGAWGLYTGWRATCLQTFGDRLFFGSVGGLVMEAEVGGQDFSEPGSGTPYTCVCVPLFDQLKAPAALKTGLQSRVTYRSSREMSVQLSMQGDYQLSLPSAPDDTSVASGTLWGSAVWGQSVWGASAKKSTFQGWQSTPGSGYALAPAVQITSGNSAAPDAEIVSIDINYDLGDVGS